MENYFCENWRALLCDRAKRRQAYNNILTDRQVFVDHLRNCEVCQKLKNSGAFLTDEDTPLLTDAEFLYVVRAIWEMPDFGKTRSL